jgi:hypothetical protein
MLATTGDGHALRLENAELRTLMPQLRQPALKQLVRANYRGNLPEAVKHSVAALSDNALRVGAVRDQQTGSSFPVFMSQLGGRTYEILTQPAADGENSVIGLRALPVRSHAEYMASSSPTAAATRQTTLGPRQALSTAAADGNNNVEGVYNIYHNGQLVYHGQSQNVRTRLGAHLRCLNELRIPIGGYQAAVGRMAGSTKQQRRGEETRRIDQSRAAGRRTGNRQREFEGEAEFPDFNAIRQMMQSIPIDVRINAMRTIATAGRHALDRLRSVRMPTANPAIVGMMRPMMSPPLQPPPPARTQQRPQSRPVNRPSPGMSGSQVRDFQRRQSQRPQPRGRR